MKRREREEMRSRERKYKDNSLGKGNNSYKSEKKKEGRKLEKIITLI